MQEPAVAPPDPQADGPDRFRIDPLTAEFLDPETEQSFRRYIKDRRVRDTRLAIVLAAAFYLAFAISDFLAMGASRDYLVVLLIRLVVCGVGLLAAYQADQYWYRLVDGLVPSLLVAVGMLGFLTITLLRPYTAGWHGMGMMAMLVGAYVFIPNRFLPAFVICLVASLAFLLLMPVHFALTGQEVLNLAGLMTVINILGAVTAYRFSHLTHEEYRDAAMLGQVNDRLRQEAEERRALEQTMLARAERDETTAVYTRRRFYELAAPALETAAKSGSVLTLLLIDVDYLRQLNVTYGHLRGDQVLKAVVAVCRRHLGETALLARYGGEEFVALLDMDVRRATALAGAIRDEAQRSPVEVSEAAIFFTVSIGAAEAPPGQPLNVLLRRADDALSAAKFKGRNRVEQAP